MRFSIWLATTFVLLIWLCGIFVEWIIPLFPNLAFTLPFFERTFSLVCHQQTHKLLGESLYHSLVCSRCAGIYFGFFFASLASLLIVLEKEPKHKIIFFAAIPMIADVLLYSLRFYTYSKLLAFTTGLLLGSVGFLYFYFALRKLIQEINMKRN